MPGAGALTADVTRPSQRRLHIRQLTIPVDSIRDQLCDHIGTAHHPVPLGRGGPVLGVGKNWAVPSSSSPSSETPRLRHTRPLSHDTAACSSTVLVTFLNHDPGNEPVPSRISRNASTDAIGNDRWIMRWQLAQRMARSSSRVW
jgi:hypothetical protein